MKKTKWLHRWSMVSVLTLALVACGTDENGGEQQAPDNSGDEPTSEERVLTDGMGNEVTISGTPENVLGTYLEDHLVALDVLPVAQWSVHGGDSIQQYLQGDLEGIPLIPHDLPFEAVSGYNPDLILVDSPALVEGGKYEQYAKIAPTFVIGEEENNDWREELLTVGEVLNKKEEAEQVLADYNTKAEEAKVQLQDSIGEQSAAAVWLINSSFFIVNENLSSGAVMYGDLGLTAPAVVQEISAADTANWSAISLEKLVELDADHLFLINSDGDGADSAIQDNLWKSIPAVQNGNVYEFEQGTAWLYQGAIANGQIIDYILESLVE
ncbi:ABC transporter substrate-binding protein [Alkalihalobacillus pseudalcaliphilus]|uniref:ABC transporter substrate-binding protein n=1 Tax=Alkalihalobacillus pseudalcaliphilus TaxID=79884 RepID=UPI00064D961D|nr:ABC transporter substrate-binding protein [Alkalihalobacillus pseudalcaliphilus]KMK75234.1 ABC transporter substrate-binding protein [Alkalihalobacillus pseudalcaliphilus]